MKKTGFVLMETIIVIVVISIALITIFSSYNKILSKVKTENRYDTSEYIYTTEYIKSFLGTSLSVNSVTDSVINDYSTYIPSFMNVKKIHILTDINDFGGNEDKFDAYMIEYLRRLDVGDDDQLIIVEYRRPVLKTDGTLKSDNKGNQLYETYVASLEW